MDTQQPAPPSDTPLPGMEPKAPPAGPRPVAAAPRPRPAAVRKPEKNTLDRLSVPVTPDGSKIAYDVMQTKVKERLRVVLLDPGLPAALGLTPIATPGGAQEKFPTDLVGMAFDYLGDAMILVAQKRGAPLDKAKALKFTTAEKNMLVEPAGRLLDKYFPGGLGRWGDEVMFGLAVFMVMSGKITMLREMVGPPSEVLPFPQQNRAEQVQ